MVGDMGGFPRCPVWCGHDLLGGAVLSVAGGERSLARLDVPLGGLSPTPPMPGGSQLGLCNPEHSWGYGVRPDISPLGLGHCGGQAHPHGLCSSGPASACAPPPQGAPARERLCSCSSVPARSTSSRPLSEPSKQPESRGMSTLGSDTVCATGSWLLSAPSSASSLPVS